MSSEIKICKKEEVTDSNLPFILWELCQNAYRDGSPWSKEQFLADLNLKNSQYLILMNKNQYVGFISYHLILDEAEVSHVVVNRLFQEKGYGKQLLKELSTVLKQQNIEKVFLEVRYSNTSAQRLYQKQAFEEIAIRKNYYSHPKEDALIMCLKLRK